MRKEEEGEKRKGVLATNLSHHIFTILLIYRYIHQFIDSTAFGRVCAFSFTCVCARQEKEGRSNQGG